MLVDYSDSDSDHPQDSNLQPLKKAKLADHVLISNAGKSPPPPPPSFYSLYATNARTSSSDDPSLHGGRTRQIPHVEGNWPTHIYIDWYPSEVQAGSIQALISKASDPDTTKSFLRSDLDVPLPLHISLSAPLVLRTDQKDKFCDAVETAVTRSGIKAFTVRPAAVRWVPNFDGTRFFLVFEMARPESNGLNKLLELCNRCAAEFGLPLLYEQGRSSSPPSPTSTSTSTYTETSFLDRSSAFHISMAWSLQEPTRDEKLKAAGVDLSGLHDTSIECKSVKVKIGNGVKELFLSTT